MSAQARQRSPEYRAGYKARLARQDHDATQGRSWAAGWRMADRVKRGDAACPVCGGGHMMTTACDLDGGLEPRPAAPSLADRLRSLISEGLTYSEAAKVFGDHQDATEPHLKAYRDALPSWAGEREVDSNAMVSKGGDAGAYVQAWVWVSDSEAGVESDDEDDEDPENEACAKGHFVRKTDETLHRAKAFRTATEAGPARLVVTVEGGNVQGVTCDRDVPGVEVLVVDYDVDDEDEAIVEVHQEGDRWATARADVFEITTEAAPITREPTEEEA